MTTLRSTLTGSPNIAECVEMGVEMGVDGPLQQVAGHESCDVDELCDHILSSLIGPDFGDDTALGGHTSLSMDGASLDLACG